MNKIGRVGTIGRWKPLHLGGLYYLESLCEISNEVIIGIGSSNKYNMRNPFTAEESEEMIRAALSPNYNNFSFIYVPDFAQDPRFANGQKWRSYVVEKFGKLDLFVSGNEYVLELLKNDYKVIESFKFVPSKNKIPIKSTEIRIAMAAFADWQKFVPEKTAKYLENKGLVKRFRREFGLSTLDWAEQHPHFNKKEDASFEKMHTMEC